MIPNMESIDNACQLRNTFTRNLLMHPRIDAVQTLNRLRALGLPIGVVSDCSREVPDIWPETVFHDLVHVTVFSCLVGVRKPNPIIYQTACDQLAVDPTACVYIGDGFSNELGGAQRLGMQAYLLLPPNEERPGSDQWEGHRWDGDMIEMLSLLPSQL